MTVSPSLVYGTNVAPPEAPILDLNWKQEGDVETGITEAEIGTLVERFYAKVRVDEEIGPIFNAIVSDWPYHEALLKDFWSTVLLTTGRYKGDPMMKHLQLSLDPQHFGRWLRLFAQTAKEVMSPEHARLVVSKAERIAWNFQEGKRAVVGRP